MYQPLTDDPQKAFGLIELGWIAGLESSGASVRVWRGPIEDGPLREALVGHGATHFLGHLQNTKRGPAPWMDAEGVRAIREARERAGMAVAMRSAPGGLAGFLESAGIDFGAFPERGVSSFYLDKRRPFGPEADVIRDGLIDVIRTPLHVSCVPELFRGFLDLGVSVLEEPHAADPTRYLPVTSVERTAKDSVVVSYFGRCWPFKWSQMGPIVLALRARFGADFRLIGDGWPAEAGAIPVGDADADASFVRESLASRVSIALHEPTQVLPVPFAHNERPFKLGCLGCAIVSDANPTLRDYFSDPLEIRVAASADALVADVEELLRRPERTHAMGASIRRRVLTEHTYRARAERLFEVCAAPGRGLIHRRLVGSSSSGLIGTRGVSGVCAA